MKHKCLLCPLAHNTINGRYCRAFKCYVQYNPHSNCKTPEQ